MELKRKVMAELKMLAKSAGRQEPKRIFRWCMPVVLVLCLAGGTGCAKGGWLWEEIPAEAAWRPESSLAGSEKQGEGMEQTPDGESEKESGESQNPAERFGEEDGAAQGLAADDGEDGGIAGRDSALTEGGESVPGRDGGLSESGEGVRKQEDGSAESGGSVQNQEGGLSESGEDVRNQEGGLSEQISFVQEDFPEYAYGTLSEEEKLWYRDMKGIVDRMEEKGELSDAGIAAGLDETDIDMVFQCLLTDHPEFFYVDGYSYTKYTRDDVLLSIEFSGSYTMSRKEAVSRKRQIEEAAAEILAGMEPSASEYEKVKYVYETIIRNTDYNLRATDNQNIYSVFINHSSVCQGYAKACQYLLDKMGIEAVLVQGTVDTGEGHAWNLVKIDGSYYYLDSTWGDASYCQEENPESVLEQESETDAEEILYYRPEINYDYLCVTTADLLRTHTLGGYLPLPECTDERANYYVQEKAYFTCYDKEQMRQLFEKYKEQEKEDVTIKCADLNCYREIEQALVKEQEIFQYLTEGGSISYAENEKQLSLTFWVTNE